MDTTKFTPGEIVELTGHVDVGLEVQQGAIEIKDTDGNIILIRSVTSYESEEFILKFKVPSTAKAGEFEISINIELDGQTFSGISSDEMITPEPTSESESISEPNCGAGTILKDGQRVVDTIKSTEEKSSKGGGCLIVTATYGSELAPQVQQLRELRGNSLL